MEEPLLTLSTVSRKVPLDFNEGDYVERDIYCVFNGDVMSSYDLCIVLCGRFVSSLCGAFVASALPSVMIA